MSKDHRVRVKVAEDQDRKPIHTFIRAKSLDELHDRIVETYVRSGRIWEFLDKETLQSCLVRKALPLKPYAEAWMQTFKTPNLTGNTLGGYRSYLNRHIYPEFGDVNLYDITVNDIQIFLNDKADLSKQTIKEIWGMLKRVLDSAVEDRHIEWNPARSKRLFNPSSKVTVREALPLHAIQEIIYSVAALDETERRLMALLLFTGMRRGEVLGLRWEDIDFGQKLIHVERACSYEVNQPTIRLPKTVNGIRDIPLDAQLELLLQPVPDSAGYIIGGEKPLSATSYRHMYERIKKSVQLHDATAHIFRHSYLSILAKANVAPKVISSIAGHGDIRVTMNRYVHDDQDDLNAAGEAFHATVDTFESVAKILRMKDCEISA